MSNTSSPLAEHPLKKMTTRVTAQKAVMARSRAFQYLPSGECGRVSVSDPDRGLSIFPGWKASGLTTAKIADGRGDEMGVSGLDSMQMRVRGSPFRTRVTGFRLRGSCSS